MGFNINSKFRKLENNTLYETDYPMTCDLCGKTIANAFQLSANCSDDGLLTCYQGKDNCLQDAYDLFFSENIDVEFAYVRGITCKSYNIRNKKKNKRTPIGLSKRYNVMKRDGFQCALCGDSGKESKLEIDHIIPVSKGGSSKIDNLQTLCFRCNRGKIDKVDGENI